jgi:dethiobiotin synthetase
VHGCLVTGTDTGAGKTVLAAALVAALVAAGEPARAHKPVITGLEEPPGPWPPDHELLGAAAGMSPEHVAPVRYLPPVSPHLAAALVGERLCLADLVATARAAARGGPLIVEGVGGLLVPLDARHTVRDFAAHLGLPVVIAARPGLGTINHTLLTLEAARAGGLDVRAVVLTPWPSVPVELERSNREAIARLGAIDVAVLGHVEAPRVQPLAHAGASLPWREWIGPAKPARRLDRDGAGGRVAGPQGVARSVRAAV